MTATVQSAAQRADLGGGRHILVLEDDEDILDSVSAVLQGAGFSVEAHKNGHEALERLRRRPVDLVLLDLMMPVMDGWEFRAAQRADASIASIPVVVMTADTSAKATAIHAEGYLRKPFGAGDLLATIERVLLDRDRRKRAATLEETGRLALLGTIAAGVGHEINNPLSFALANLELIERHLAEFEKGPGEDAPGDQHAFARKLAELAEYSRDMRTGLERVKLVVKNLQSLSRRTDDDKSLVELYRAIDASISMARSHTKYRARVTTSFEALPPIWANEGRLGQVFLNLLVNAAQSIPIGQVSTNEIGVATKRQADFAVVEFRDTGVGMSKALLQRIFEPFFTTKGQGEGTGLGLPICKDIVEAHGGRLEVESEPGRGSVFRVFLPIQTSGERQAIALAAEARTEASPSPNLDSSRRPKLWVVDDERLVSEVIGRILRRDCEVVLTEGPKDVFARLEAGERFEVMLCDVMMPEMTGVELCNQVSAKWPALAERIVFMSGGTLAPSLSAFIHRPGRLFLEKPFDAGSLRAIVGQVIEKGG